MNTNFKKRFQGSRPTRGHGGGGKQNFPYGILAAFSLVCGSSVLTFGAAPVGI
jgi:hypothetical protein